MNNFFSSLFKYLNNPDIHDTNYQIAYTLILYCNEIENMSVNELAEKCYVSVTTLNRFFKIYGYPNFSIFKNMFLQHIKIRKNQMLYRMKHKKPKQVKTMLLSCFNQATVDSIFSSTIIHQCCNIIKNSKRIILIGSDEMEGHCNRFQVDFSIMGKPVIHDSIFSNCFFEPNQDDFVILLSMAGRIIETNEDIIERINTNNPKVAMIGYQNYLKNGLFLQIPKQVDEVIEDMVLNFYIQEIMYTYMRDYYDY